MHELSQDALEGFGRSWEDAEGRAYITLDKTEYWNAPRNAKTLHYFFQRGISRKWITEDPCGILRFPKQDTTKKNEDLKHLRPERFAEVPAHCDKFTRMTDYNKQRIKALVLTMRWTGLRISDAVVLTCDKTDADVLRVRTNKASTPVQIPLHPELTEALLKLQPYESGYYFWNRRTDGTKISTPQGNFGNQLAEIFQNAGIEIGRAPR